MSLPFQLARNNAFSKLKKAIKNNDIEKMVMSMLHLEFNGKSGVIPSDNFMRQETMRAFRHLKNLHRNSVPPSVLAALEIAKSKANKFRERLASPPAPTEQPSSTPTEATTPTS